MRVYWIWYALLPGMSGRTKAALLRHFHGPEDIYQLDRSALRGMEGLSAGVKEALLNKDLQPARALIKDCGEKGIGILAFSDSAYPDRLRNIQDPPMVLYYKGKVPTMELQPVIGVVGTRKASPYGLRIAMQMGEQIAACGGMVVSGGARGIDTVALEGALAQGKTTAVFQAGGLDKLYPKENTELFTKIMENGCIFSEYPPGTSCYRGNFLRRNRLISGISDAVLVVEAPKVSGALNTARWASEQGRDVFVVPGNVDMPSCEGSNSLIGDIAKAAANGWAIMREYESRYPDTVKQARPVDVSVSGPVRSQPAATLSGENPHKITVDNRQDCPYSVIENDFSGFSEQERAILTVLTKTPTPVDQVMEKLSIPSGTALSILTKLSLKGVVKNHPGKLISLN